jgi:hypothetical protein
MHYLLTAALAFFGAGPLAAWLLQSPYAAWLAHWRAAPDITNLLGNPDWLLLAVFLLACHGAAGCLLAAAREFSGSLLDTSGRAASRHVLPEAPGPVRSAAARKAP